MNLIGKCVVSGNVRRTAEIAFGDPTSDEYIDLKNYEVNPQRMDFGWTSNNSVFANLGMNYDKIASRICKNGEPGVAWLDNMQQYSRMNGVKDNKDFRAKGGNPCLEQTLESYELW
jgi:ribonucleoside-triphosphate reductase